MGSLPVASSGGILPDFPLGIYCQAILRGNIAVFTLGSSPGWILRGNIAVDALACCVGETPGYKRHLK